MNNLFKLTGAAVILSLLPLTSCNKSGENQYADYDLIPVKATEDGKWSMINEKGEIVYDSEFKNRPSAAVNGLFTVEEDGGYTVFKIGDKSPKVVNDLEGLKFAGTLKGGLMPVTFKHSRISIVDKDGKKKFDLEPVKGKEIITAYPCYEEGLLLFMTEEGKLGYYSTTGKVAIDPKYDTANLFSDGLAVVGQYKDEKDKNKMNYSVIDKSGKVVFKIKEGYDLGTRSFKSGYLVTQKDDRIYLVNKKGEETKLPSKISDISDYNSKYIIFENDGEYGVADIKGEVIIRAKYDGMIFDTEDTFFAKKDDNDKDIVRLSAKGDEEKVIDYEYVVRAGKFGYFAKEGKTYLLLNNKFEKKSKEEFFEFSPYPSICDIIESDYFNPAGVAGVMVGMIQGNKVCGLTMGDKAASVMSGKAPKDYSYTYSFDIEDAKTEGFRYEIEATAHFTYPIADYTWDYDDYSARYYWNPNSELGAISIRMGTNSDWGKEGQKALTEALTGAGYKLVEEGDEKALFKKGKILVMASSYSNGAELAVYDSSVDGLEDVESRLKSKVLESYGDDEVVAVEAYPNAEVTKAEGDDW